MGRGGKGTHFDPASVGLLEQVAEQSPSVADIRNARRETAGDVS